MWQNSDICQQVKPRLVANETEELKNVDHSKYLGSVYGTIVKDVDLACRLHVQAGENAGQCAH